MTDDNRREQTTQGRIVFRPVPGEPGVLTAMVRGPTFSRFFVLRPSGIIELHRIESDPEPVAEALTRCPCCSRPLAISVFEDGRITVTPEPAPEDDIPS
jgi:hypothetical protein